MRKASLPLIVIAIGVLAAVLAAGIFCWGDLSSNSSLTPSPVAMPIPTVVPTTIMTPVPTSNPAATPNSGHKVTYSEQSRNQTMIVIQFKLEPNSYIFQLNATSFVLAEGGARISANTNDAVIIGTQYSTLYFPVNGYNGTDYHLSSDALPLNTVWIRK
jgi:hypothetical protein